MFIFFKVNLRKLIHLKSCFLKGETKNESKKDDASNDEPSQTAIAESLEEDEEEKEELDEDENTLVMTGSNYATVGKKSFLGHTCTLKTLLDDQVLIAEDGALSFEFMVRISES